MSQQDRINDLLEEFKEQREELKKMVQDVEKQKEQVETLFSKGSRDYRSMRIFEEKLRAATEFYKTILEMRKEINRSLKEESEMRRKIDSGDSGEDIGDIRALANSLESMWAERETKKQKMEEEISEET